MNEKTLEIREFPDRPAAVRAGFHVKLTAEEADYLRKLDKTERSDWLEANHDQLRARGTLLELELDPAKLGEDRTAQFVVRIPPQSVDSYARVTAPQDVMSARYRASPSGTGGAVPGSFKRRKR